MTTPKQVFDILRDQHILKSQLSYEELSTTKNFILIKNISKKNKFIGSIYGCHFSD